MINLVSLVIRIKLLVRHVISKFLMDFNELYCVDIYAKLN